MVPAGWGRGRASPGSPCPMSREGRGCRRKGRRPIVTGFEETPVARKQDRYHPVDRASGRSVRTNSRALLNVVASSDGLRVRPGPRRGRLSRPADASHKPLTCTNVGSGRRESDPHDQLGRLAELPCQPADMRTELRKYISVVRVDHRRFAESCGHRRTGRDEVFPQSRAVGATDVSTRRCSSNTVHRALDAVVTADHVVVVG